MPPITERPASEPALGHPAVGGFTFFFYGTLCDSEVRAVVIGRALDAIPSLLADYEAVPVARGRFPILQFQRGCTALGVVCEGVRMEEAARLSLFEDEGRDYAANALTVLDAGKTSRRAWVFLPTGMLRRGPGRWDLAEWQRFAKRDFLLRTQRAMRALEPRRLEPYLKLWAGRSRAPLNALPPLTSSS